VEGTGSRGGRGKGSGADRGIGSREQPGVVRAGADAVQDGTVAAGGARVRRVHCRGDRSRGSGPCVAGLGYARTPLTFTRTTVPTPHSASHT